MFVESLDLASFRNYSSLSMSFDEGTNILYGDNAQGKTNILESIYLCGTTKSHKGSKDRDMVQFDKDEAHIRMMVHKREASFKIDMHLRKNKTKGVAVNGIPIKKASELFGIINLVFFSPEDLNIIKNGPAERRKFIDSELCQCSKLYMMQLTNYNRILNQRNKLLKDIRDHVELFDTLDIWDEQLLSYGSSIIKERKSFIKEINPVLEEIHGQLTGGKEKIKIVYDPNVDNEMFRDHLFINRERDLKMQTSTTGPHRDDYSVIVNGIDIRKFGSQGQQRSAALSLKLSEIQIMKKMIHDTPVLLLDDVLSELDSSRQNYLLKQIKDIQTFITCTGMDDFIKHHFSYGKVFHVEKGTVRTIEDTAGQE